MNTQLVVSDVQNAQSVQIDWDRFLKEAKYALAKVPTGKMAWVLTTSVPGDAIKAVARRGKNILSLAGKIGIGALTEVVGAAYAAKRGKFVAYTGWRLGVATGTVASAASSAVNGAQTLLKASTEEKVIWALQVLVGVEAWDLAGGGLDFNGGVPDLDIPLLGIGAHRSPFTHSIIAGAAVEALFLTAVRAIRILHAHLPDDHMPEWDKWHDYALRIVGAGAMGARLGIATHLAGDGLLQPAPYHVPLVEVHAPMDIHSAVLVTNAVAEAGAGTPPALRETKPERPTTARHEPKVVIASDRVSETAQADDAEIVRFESLPTRAEETTPKSNECNSRCDPDPLTKVVTRILMDRHIDWKRTCLKCDNEVDVPERYIKAKEQLLGHTLSVQNDIVLHCPVCKADSARLRGVFRTRYAG